MHSNTGALVSLKAERNKKNRWGYLDKKGLFGIPATFVQAGDFTQGMALVQTAEGNCAGINSNGEILWTHEARGICLSENEFRARVKETAKAKYIRDDNVFLFSRTIEKDGIDITQVIDSAGRLIWHNVSFEDSAAIDLMTYVSTLEAIEKKENNKYENAVEKFTENCSEYGLVPSSKPIPRLMCGGRYRASFFSEDLAYLEFRDQNGTKKLYITDSGKLGLMLPAEILVAGHFFDGLAPACVNSGSPWCKDTQRVKLGFIGKNGQFDVEPEFSPEYDFIDRVKFQEGICILKKGGRLGAINKKGEEVVPFEYISMSNYHEGLCAVLTE